jgi:hypothetical protein
MSSAGSTQRQSTELPELIAIPGARRVLDDAEHNAHLARVLTCIEDELSDRLHTDLEDVPTVTTDERVARRRRLLTRMAGRYRSAADGRNGQSRSNAFLMLAAMHRLDRSGRLGQV